MVKPSSILIVVSPMKKANDIFRSSTGTVPAKRQVYTEEAKKAKKKKKKPKKKRESANQKLENSSNDEDESNWQEGDAQAEENAVTEHLE